MCYKCCMVATKVITIIAGAYDPCAVFKYETGYVADENKSFELTTDIRMDLVCIICCIGGMERILIK